MKKLRIPTPRVDYHGFQLKRIREPQHRHLLLLLFWPVFVLRYLVVEQIPPLGPYHVIHCPLDDLIPFCELFLIPYGLWFVCLASMQIYTMYYDLENFKRFTKFMMIACGISTLTFLVYPSCQNLRPEVFPRDNFLTKIVGFVYWFDTSTNVCPSEHAIGSFAIFAAAAHCRGLRKPKYLIPIGAMMVLIVLSTLFLKQHSVVDLLAAVPVCAFAYWLVYGRKKKEMHS